MTPLLAGLPLLITAALIGLIIGSFLNVVIHRLPEILHHQWRSEAAAILDRPPPSDPPPGLAYPGSRCPHCSQPINAWQNLPVIGFLLLKGRAHCCHEPISWRYPAVELLCGAWFAWCASAYSTDLMQAGLWATWGAVVLALAWIDWRTYLLPDDLTQPLLWGSLGASSMGWIPTLPADALLGAALGYGILALPAWLFERLTGKVGMAPGDFKFLAAVGAGLGWMSVIPVLLLACGVGIALALAQRWRGTPHDSVLGSGAIPFGPAIAAAAVITQIWPNWPMALQWLQ